jgi:hypothetical protein
VKFLAITILSSVPFDNDAGSVLFPQRQTLAAHDNFRHPAFSRRFFRPQDGAAHQPRLAQAFLVPATAANKREAKLRRVDEGHPLLLLQDVISDKEGRAYEYARVLFRGEKIKISLEF